MLLKILSLGNKNMTADELISETTRFLPFPDIKCSLKAVRIAKDIYTLYKDNYNPELDLSFLEKGRAEKLKSVLEEIVSDAFADSYGIADWPGMDEQRRKLATETAFYQKLLRGIK